MQISTIYIFLATPDTNHSLNQLRCCLQDIFHWMNDSKLKLNTDKTEFLIIGTQRQRDKIECFFPTPLLDQNFAPTASARNLGIIFENIFYFVIFITFEIFVVPAEICLFLLRKLLQLLSLAVGLTTVIPYIIILLSRISETSACAELLVKCSY